MSCITHIYQHHGEMLRAVLPDDAGITWYYQVVSSCKLVDSARFLSEVHRCVVGIQAFIGHHSIEALPAVNCLRSIS